VKAGQVDCSLVMFMTVSGTISYDIATMPTTNNSDDTIVVDDDEEERRYI